MYIVKVTLEDGKTVNTATFFELVDAIEFFKAEDANGRQVLIFNMV